MSKNGVLDTGDIVLTSGDLKGLDGDFNWNLDNGDTANIDGEGSPTADLLHLGSGDTIGTDNVEPLFITYSVNDASTNGLFIDPTLTDDDGDGSADSWDIIEIDALIATLAADAGGALTSTVRALAIGNLTETAGGDESITSTAVDIGTGWDVGLALGSGLQLDDDISIAFGTSSDTLFLWETADADANEMIMAMPEGGVTNVPVLVVGDASIVNANLGFFNGITDPTIALVSDDAGDYGRLTVSDAGHLTLDTVTAGSDIALTPVDDFQVTSVGVIVDSSAAVNVTSTSNAGSDIYLRANGGTSETIKLHADQGTGVASLDLLSDVGGISLTAGLSTSDAINLTANGANSGIDIDSTSTITINTTNDEIQIATGNQDVVLSGSARDTAALTLTAGDLNISSGDLNVTSGDFNVGIFDGDTVHIDGDGTPTADLLILGNGDTTATAIDGLDITLTTAEGASGTNLLNLNPTFASTTNSSTHSAMNIANIAATSTTNNLIARGINIGTVTEAGTGTVASTALNVGTGWDTILGGTTAGTNLIGFSNFTVTTAGAGTFGTDLTVTGGDITGANLESIDIGEAVDNEITFTMGGAAEITMSTTALLPATSDGSALGSTALQWSDLFLAEGGVINWDNGDATITQTNNVIAVAGITNFNINTTSTKSALNVETTSVGAITYPLTLINNSGGTNGEGVGLYFSPFDTGATPTAQIYSTRVGSSNYDLVFGTINGSTVMTDRMKLNVNGHLQPATNDSGQLGISGTAWSDLFLASGGVINWNNGDVTLTHAADSLTIAGGDFDVALIDGVSMNIDGDGSPTADLLVLGSGDTTATANLDALNITLTTAEGADGSTLINLNPTFAATTASTFNVMNVAAFTATSTTNAMTTRGLNIGTLTEAGTGTVVSTALQVGTGWDTIIGGTTAGTNLIDFSEFDVSGTNGSITIDDNGDAGKVLVEGTNLDINDLTFVSAGTVASAAGALLTVDSGTSGGLNLGTNNTGHTINLGTGTGGNSINIGTNNTVADTIAIGSSIDALTLRGTTLTIGNAADGSVSIADNDWSVTTTGAAVFVSVQNPTYTSGGNSNLSITPSGTGDFVLNLDADTNAQITAGAAPGVDLISVTNAGQATTTDLVDALSLNWNATNASTNTIDISPTFTDNNASADGENWNVISVSNFTTTAQDTAAAAVSTVNGIRLGNLTETVDNDILTSHGIDIGSGWDANLFFNDTTTTVSMLDGGTLTFNDSAGNIMFSFADSGTDGDLTVSSDIFPDAANGNNLGSTTAEWDALYVGDGTATTDGLILGDAQEVRLVHDTTLDRVSFLGTDANLFIEDQLTLGVDLVTVADNTVGASKAVFTLTPASSFARITCNDPDGCNMTLGEGSAQDGDMVVIAVASTNSVDANDTAGVTELSGNFILGQYDTLSLIYSSDRWLQLSTANN